MSKHFQWNTPIFVGLLLYWRLENACSILGDRMQHADMSEANCQINFISVNEHYTVMNRLRERKKPPHRL